MKFSNLRFYAALLAALSVAKIDASCCPVDCDDSSKSCSAECAISNNTWLPRSFSSYSFHDLFQMKHTNALDDQEHKLNFTFLTDYMQNFGGKCGNGCKNLGSRPFWSGDNTLTIGRNDGKAQLDAYQLGLGNVDVDEDGIAGTISLNPKVQHIGTDMMMYYAQSKDESGVFFKLHAPLVAMKIKPNLKEVPKVAASDDLNFYQTTAAPDNEAITYQFLEYSPEARRPKSISEAFFGGVLEDGALAGNAEHPIRLRKARIAGCDITSIRLADLTASLGYNFLVREKGYVGVGFKASMPTGNMPTADYMLEPIVGRAGAWGMGGELSAMYQIWENDEGSRRVTVSLQGEVLHLAPGRTPGFRTFDLKQNGPGSKYLLLQEYTAMYKEGASSSSPQFPANEQIYRPVHLTIAANHTTLPVISKIAIEGSCALMFDFACNDWNMSVGGEFWGRSQEKLGIDMRSAVDLRIVDLNKFAVLGRQVSGYRINGHDIPTSPIATDDPIEAFYCEPLAKINESLNPVTLEGVTATATKPTTLPDGIADARDPKNRIPAALDEALDICGAQAARAFTGKVFGQFGYTWSQRNHQPSLAVFGGAEFTNKTNNAVQLWNVGLQGSLNF